MRFQRRIRQTHERLADDIGERHARLPGDTMPRARDDHQLIARGQMGLQRRQVGDIRDDPHFGAPGGECEHELAARALLQVDGKIGITREKVAQLPRQERSERGGVRQQPDAPFQPGGIRVQFAAHLLNLLEDQACMSHQRVAGRGRAHAPACALQKRRAQRGFHP